MLLIPTNDNNFFLSFMIHIWAHKKLDKKHCRSWWSRKWSFIQKMKRSSFLTLFLLSHLCHLVRQINGHYPSCCQPASDIKGTWPATATRSWLIIHNVGGGALQCRLVTYTSFTIFHFYCVPRYTALNTFYLFSEK